MGLLARSIVFIFENFSFQCLILYKGNLHSSSSESMLEIGKIKHLLEENGDIVNLKLVRN